MLIYSYLFYDRIGYDLHLTKLIYLNRMKSEDDLENENEYKNNEFRTRIFLIYFFNFTLFNLSIII